VRCSQHDPGQAQRAIAGPAIARSGLGNHTFVADSFEKRDDFRTAQQFSYEFFHFIFRRRALDVLSEIPDRNH
jgi:hypothetical protein